MSPFLKLSSVSLVAVKSYFPCASIRTELDRWGSGDVSADEDSKIQTWKYELGYVWLDEISFSLNWWTGKTLKSLSEWRTIKLFLDEGQGASSSFTCWHTNRTQRDGKWDHFMESRGKIKCDLKQLEEFRLLVEFSTIKVQRSFDKNQSKPTKNPKRNISADVNSFTAWYLDHSCLHLWRLN